MACECTYTDGGGLSFCQPGGNITLYNPAEINDKEQVVLRNDQTGHTDDACYETIYCGRIVAVKESITVKIAVSMPMTTMHSAYIKNLQKLSTSYLAVLRDTVAICLVLLHVFVHITALHLITPLHLRINILCDEQFVNPSCSIYLSERRTWRQGFGLDMHMGKGIFWCGSYC